MFLLFFLLWLLLSGGISVHTCLWGVAVSALISWFCKRVLGYQWRVFCGSPSRIWAMARYFAHLLAEMLKAGLVIMRIIYTRPKGIEPKLVWFHTPLKTDRRRAMLADSITLTAGTITVRAEDGRMLVHTLDTPLAEGIEDSAFQQRLEKIGGVPNGTGEDLACWPPAPWCWPLLILATFWCGRCWAPGSRTASWP